MRKADLAAKVFYQGGGAQVTRLLFGQDLLTVLAYHRIADPAAPDFDGFEPNVSATPALFAQQMAWVGENYSVISLDQLRAFVVEGAPLPPKPLLITFDDGYLDNYSKAFPILKEQGFPAVIFLMTSRMDDTTRRPWWDETAYYFHKTHQTSANLPLIGAVDFISPDEKTAVRDRLLGAMKLVPKTEKLKVLEALPAALSLDPAPSDTPLFVNWDQVRELVANGVACQPHTVNHPILTRIPLEEARRELAESKAKIEAETDQRAYALAYTNGQLTDYNPQIMQILRELGYDLAFTLSPGPLSAKAARQHPLEIARVFLGHRDTFELFVAKTLGLPRLRYGLKFLEPELSQS